jgi:two-component system chemotaxis response regulator CheY
MKALIMESSSTMRKVLQRILNLRGFEVAEAESGAGALEELSRSGVADLVLIDWSMDETESLEFIHRMRGETQKNPTVLMMASTKPEPRKIRRALIAGADDYLMKPFTSSQLDEKLSEAGFAL